MSGFVALVELDGAPVNDRLLRRMTEALAFRGPDGQRRSLVDGAGLGFALLRTGEPAIEGSQPFTLDGRQWIVGDARIDARHELVKRLDATGGSCPAHITDVELLARAYRAWGEACASQLLGDFSFVVWDLDRRQLFAARDHLGVKPLFSARIGSTLVVSNTLDCIRRHPRISTELNELSIADFLLFGENRDANATAFRDITRLPPAHTCVWSRDAMRATRYWTLPVDEPVHYRHHGDYLERFNDLLHESVADRTRTDQATVLMSGGLDSPTLAAAAQAANRNRRRFAIDAVTSVFDHLIPDGERDFASLVAAHLGIPIRYDVRDREVSLAQWDDVRVRTPEPVANPMAFVASIRFLETTARGARVFLYGEGPDNALRYEWRPYLRHLMRTRQPRRLMQALLDDVWMHPRPIFWSSIRQAATAGRHERRWNEQFPDWLEPSFSTRLGCRDRWTEQRRDRAPMHPVRPFAYATLDPVRWQSLFDDCDVTGGRGHVEFRHPYLDLRLLRYLLALPAMPWCRNKLIIRRAMRGALPPAVLQRKKTTVPTSADFQRVRTGGLPRPSSSPELTRFVNPSRMPVTVASERELRSALRPLGLGYWLEHRANGESEEQCHGIENTVAV